MHNDVFIFDQVIHMYDNSKENIVNPEAANAIFKFATSVATPNIPSASHKDFFRQMPVEEAYHLLFEKSETDMVMAQTVPMMGGSWRAGFSPAARQYAFAKAYPERVIFCGGVDPIAQGVDGALYELERQIVEWGARSMKFYQVQGNGMHWRADDPKLAYPLYEKCLELGVNSVQFHKGTPFGRQRVELLMPNDLQDAAAEYPEMTFINHHLAEPYVAETLSISARFPNVWVALSGFLGLYPFRPMETYHLLGKLLMYVGADRLMYGSEAFGFPRVQGSIDVLFDLEMSEELQNDYGYPPITDDVRRKIAGENIARLLGIDIEAKKRELYGDKKIVDQGMPNLQSDAAE
jgi:predicted TIM-barrel fold metal-dependent hydrolase